jgi:hypothetical protein
VSISINFSLFIDIILIPSVFRKSFAPLSPLSSLSCLKKSFGKIAGTPLCFEYLEAVILFELFLKECIKILRYFESTLG